MTLAATGSAVVGGGSTGGLTAVDESPTGAWFVGLSSSPDQFRAKATAAGLQYNERFRFGTLWKGISVTADGQTAQLMQKLDGVVSVQPVGTASIGPIQQTSEPEERRTDT